MPFDDLPVELAALIEREIGLWKNSAIAPLILVSRAYRQTFTCLLYRTVVLSNARSFAAFLSLADAGEENILLLEHVRSLSIWRAADEPDYVDYLAHGPAIINACPNLVNLQLAPLLAPADLLLLALKPRIQRIWTYDTTMGASLLSDRPTVLTLNSPATHLHVADIDSFTITASVSQNAFPCLAVFSTTCPGWFATPVAARVAQAIGNVLKLPTISRVVVHLMCAKGTDYKSCTVRQALRDLDDARVFAVAATPELQTQWRITGLDMWRRDVTGLDSMWETGEQLCPA
ncbi:hypothetical protein AURDEDRAFT_186589 [Auricularia subglabra TFB-10046 SS5]|uniref:Uncharacterized protein n=1 Tax=Auricularia subglabra (strain TFB-10046 / SS5) TaxID=717982 RepID=J0WXH0_AURST|nr:hypothetical protein AURDEDRAFT_186589 [Auricularia subglabra TFB-10046 SS5]